MESFKIDSLFFRFKDTNDLPQDIQDLMEKAIKARKNAYAPYSKFQVGAAVLLENGKIVCGSNQENASYPEGLCAERTAVFYAGSKYPEQKIVKLIISAYDQKNHTSKPIAPCGACRQSLIEYETKQNTPIEIYFTGNSGTVIKSNSVANLLPFSFVKHLL